MRDGLFLAGIVVLAIFLGAISNEFGVTQPVIGQGGFTAEPNAPGSGGIFDQILAPLTYVFNAVAAFFQIITFQVNGIPPLLSVMILLPMSITTLWLVIRLIRGGG